MNKNILIGLILVLNLVTAFCLFKQKRQSSITNKTYAKVKSAFIITQAIASGKIKSSQILSGNPRYVDVFSSARVKFSNHNSWVCDIEPKHPGYGPYIRFNSTGYFLIIEESKKNELNEKWNKLIIQKNEFEYLPE